MINKPQKPKQIKIYPELFSFLNGEETITINDFINTWVDMCKKGDPADLKQEEALYLRKELNI